MSELKTTTVQQFEDGAVVPQPGFAPLAAGATIPVTTNLLAGNGAGGVTDAGVLIGDVAILNEPNTFEGDIAIEGSLTVDSFIECDSLVVSGALADGTYTPVTSITILNGVITAIS